MGGDNSWEELMAEQSAEPRSVGERPFKATVFPEFYTGPFGELKMFIRRPTEKGSGTLIHVSGILGGLRDPSDVIIYRGKKYSISISSIAPEYDDGEGIYSAVQVIPEQHQDAMAVALMVWGSLNPLPEHRCGAADASHENAGSSE